MFKASTFPSFVENCALYQYNRLAPLRDMINEHFSLNNEAHSEILTAFWTSVFPNEALEDPQQYRKLGFRVGYLEQ